MKVTIYGKANCPDCVKAKSLCEYNAIPFETKMVGVDVSIEQLNEMVGIPVRSVPQIFCTSDGFTEYVGNVKDLEILILASKTGRL